MRLLNTRTGDFQWIENPEETAYAILSHTWSPNGEQTYAELLAIQAEVRSARESCARSGSPSPPENEVLLRACPKVRYACAYALSQGMEHLWIDSSCIDKTNSAELSEAINSMYKWYSYAAVCYAFLEDVNTDDDPLAPDSQFRSNRWFTRGWTLQELIAPRAMLFCSAEWEPIGGKDSLAELIEDITGIDATVLVHAQPLASISVARRMFWASKRVTTRKEDEAYSLMGIFGVNMATIYGEGRLAFVRLQEEISKEIPDQSLFAWENSGGVWITDFDQEESGHPRTLLAASPADFARSSNVRSITKKQLRNMFMPKGVELPPESYLVTPYGIRATFPILPIGGEIKLALLSCVNKDNQVVALVLRPGDDANADAYSVGAILQNHTDAMCYWGCNEDPTAKRPSGAWRPFWHPIHPGVRSERSDGDGPEFNRVVCLAREMVWTTVNAFIHWNRLENLLTYVERAELCIAHKPGLASFHGTARGRYPGAGPSDDHRARAFWFNIPARCRSHLASVGYTLSMSSGPTATSTVDEHSELFEHRLPSGLRVPPSVHTIRIDPPLASDGEAVVVSIRPSQCLCTSHGDLWTISARVSTLTEQVLEVDHSHMEDHTELFSSASCDDPCEDPYEHVGSWNKTGTLPIRWQRFLPPARSAAEASSSVPVPKMVTPLLLTFLRDFVGDAKYPAVFSLSLEIFPSMPRSAFKSPNVSRPESREQLVEAAVGEAAVDEVVHVVGTDARADGPDSSSSGAPEGGANGEEGSPRSRGVFEAGPKGFRKLRIFRKRS